MKLNVKNFKVNTEEILGIISPIIPALASMGAFANWV
jgi:hypothetical protein